MNPDAQKELTKEQREHFSWLNDDGLRHLCGVLQNAKANSVRFVGGCVRDCLLGIVPGDLDMAVSIEPDQVMAILRAAKIKAIPTGIEHGTITAVLKNDQTVEITTLRKDMETDGRHAIVKYTDDWAEDAARRDFTINAIYISPDGALYDPVGGLEDIAGKQIRFIGDPQERIREDYLRILRFFRFSARFSTVFDPEGLAAAAQLKEGIDKLSKERVGSEFLKILALPRAAEAIAVMREQNILSRLWADADQITADDVDRLRTFKGVEDGALNQPIASMASLLTLIIASDEETVTDLQKNLRLSRKQVKAINALQSGLGNIIEVAGDVEARRALYKTGDEFWEGALYLAQSFAPDRAAFFRPYKSLPQDWPVPKFSLSGRDLLEYGLDAGPEISRILNEIERQWIAADFPPENQLREMLEHYLAGKPNDLPTNIV